jgi:type VI protein secretion system component VasF
MGRHVLAESHEIAGIVPAVTTYVARRLIERQRALEADPALLARAPAAEAGRYRRRRRLRIFGTLALGFIAGVVTLIVLALLLASRG